MMNSYRESIFEDVSCSLYSVNTFVVLMNIDLIGFVFHDKYQMEVDKLLDKAIVNIPFQIDEI
jgi:hypothetical protein